MSTWLTYEMESFICKWCLYNSKHLDASLSYLQEGKLTFHELSELSFGDSPGEHSCHLSFVNKLREHWHKGQNAIVFDDRADQVIASFIQLFYSFLILMC